MEPPAKRIKFEPESEPNLSALPAVDISAARDCKEELSFQVKAELHPHCTECKLFFQSDTEHALQFSNWHYEHLCEDCDKGFPDSHSFDAHKKTHPGLPIKCLGCKLLFAVHSSMVKHLENGHCTSGATANLLAKASDDYMNQRIFNSSEPPSSTLDPTCQGCGTVSNTMSQAIAHLESRTCTARGWLDDYKPLFKVLQQRIMEVKGNLPVCVGCDKEFTNTVGLQAHLKAKHTSTYCFSCSTHFKSAHEREHHSVHLAATKKGQFHYRDCRPAITFHKEKEYDDHRRVSHTACGPCDFVFGDADSLLDHDAQVHHMHRSGAIPTSIEEPTATAPVMSAPIRIKAEPKEVPVARTKNTHGETQPGPSTSSAAALMKEHTKQAPKEASGNPNLTCRGCSWTAENEDMLKLHKIWCNPVNNAHGVTLARNNTAANDTGNTSTPHQSTSYVIFVWTSSKA